MAVATGTHVDDAAERVDGLFAWSFMDTAQMSRYPGIYARIRDAVGDYGRVP